MAIDTREKRSGALSLSAPYRTPGVGAPDNSLGQGEQQIAAYVYPGIIATHIQTRQKRSSVFLLVPITAPGVVPDSGIDAAERMAAAWVYSGIDTSVASSSGGIYRPILRPRRR